MLHQSDEVQSVSHHYDGIRYKWLGVDCIAVPQTDIHAALLKVVSRRASTVLTSQEGSDQIANAARRAGAVVIGLVHSISEVGTLVVSGAPNFVIAPSCFVARYLACMYGVRSFVSFPPFIPPALERPGERETPRHITMINPIRPKGGSLVWELARAHPSLRFEVVIGWFEDAAMLCERPPNVVVTPRQADLARVWARSQVLLVPSFVPEAFGRVVVEAGLHGVPSITSGRGGLPEAQRSGGFSASVLDVGRWNELIEMLADPDICSAASSAAFDAAVPFVRDVVDEFRQGYWAPALGHRP